jgi:translocation and assembly module TamB
MPEEEVEQREEPEERRQTPGSEDDGGVPVRRRRFTRRHAAVSGGVLALILILLSVLSVVFYRYGVFDNYVKTQFIAKMERMGIVFDADVFRVTVFPLELELKNATFNDKTTGEKLFFIRDAHLGLSVTNLYAWQLSRDISVDTTDINGAEVWVTFDSNGRSNFSNLHFVEEERARVNFLYESVRFSLEDSVVHFGDESRTIEADANNFAFLLEPEDLSVPDDQKRYKIDLSSTDSTFSYNGNVLDQIDIHAHGVADRSGAEISELKLTTPVGDSTLYGSISDWKAFQYNFNVESSVDLTQTSTIFPLGTAIRGIGNFKGNITGQGEQYKIVGQADSQSLAAAGVYLKGVNIAATVQGSNTTYEANGKAIAELLTFEDFRVESPQIVGNIRGTGTDFRWVGDLQAIAASSGSMTIGRLFLSDAVAEIKDREFGLTAGTGRAARFSVADTEFADLATRDLRFTRRDGVTTLSAPGATASTLRAKDYTLHGVTGNNVRVKDTSDRTDVDIDSLRAANGSVKNATLRNVSADKFHLTDRPNTTDITATNLRAQQLQANGASITGLVASEVTLQDTPSETLIYSDGVRFASLDAGSAVLGSLNIAGVRLTIREGTVSGTSADIDAGNITLRSSGSLPDGGSLENVKIAKPVFVLEPSGRYRASADMSIGGGALGSIDLGSARAAVEVNNDRVALNDLTASLMEGSAKGDAVIGFSDRTPSRLNVQFTDLDIGKVLALQAGRVLPIEGQTTGAVNLTFNGTNFRNATGTVAADIRANAGTAENGLVPVTGRVELSAANGLFDVNYAKLSSQNSTLNATGRFDLRNENTNLTVALNSTDASEIDRIIRDTGISPGLEAQLTSNDVHLAGNFDFNGTVTGNFTDPNIEGHASLGSISMRGRELGSLASDISVSPTGIEVKNGKLTERDGGTVAFDVNIPSSGTNNTSIQATLTNVDAANLIAALPIAGYLPEGIRDFTAQTSGTVNITGLPNNAVGGIDISSASGSVAGQEFSGFRAKATFQGTLINLDNLEIATADGSLTAKGTYDRSSTAFNFDVTGKNVQLAGLRQLLPQSGSIPNITGVSDFTAKAIGNSNNSASYDINFNGTARNVLVNDYAFGDVVFKGSTADQQLNADLTATINGRPQIITASVNFANEDLPFHLETTFDQSPIEPYLAFFPQLSGQPMGGTATGKVEIAGNLSALDANGNRNYTSGNLRGSALFSQLNLRFQDTPLIASAPVSINFNSDEITIDNAHFTGGGSNMTVNGTIALKENGANNFTVDGRVNLNLLNLASRDTFFSGFADVAVRYVGPSSTARLSGTAAVDNASVSTFVGSDRITFDRIKTNILFTSNQAQIEQATGYLGGGKFVASGGALLSGLQLKEFRLDLNGTNVTVPLPKDFITTGDAQLQVSGRRFSDAGELQMSISGRVLAKRSLYSKDIELSNIVGSRHDASLSAGGGSLGPVLLDLTIEGRDALIVRNNVADLTASVSLHLTGDAEDPRVAGRITANSGTIFFRNDRYVVQRGVLEFPPETSIEPIISLQAETEIAGYQIFVNLSGPLTDTEQLAAVVRSSPALPQADVVSLITTGNLSNTESGIPTLAQSGINTAAEILADTIINEPARKATDKLFGLNVFEIDPIISGERLNPSARLTVGRQINNNLRVTYSTNLSQDQNQVLALEYRVSNKLSFVAQYEQRSLSNVTRNRDNFSFEIRFRRRF